MKLCYFDESGTGLEPIAVVVGVIVDSQRMHVTKEHWGELLARLSAIVGKPLAELHTKDFYAGNGAFRGMAGEDRAKVIDEVIEWFCARKHSFVYSAIHKQTYDNKRAAGALLPGLGSAWQAAAFHSVLALQRAHQTEAKTKGHTLLIFDNKGHEEPKLVDLVSEPPNWSEEYYGRKKKQPILSHIIDAPYFAQSHRVPLIQIADFLAYFLRRHAEIHDGHVPEKYAGEGKQIGDWVRIASDRTIGSQHIYPAKARCAPAQMFYENCPPALLKLAP